MKKKIAILGSTGFIGKTLLNLLSTNKNKFEILLLTANKNYKELYQQSKKFNVKNLIITDKKSYSSLLKINKNKKIKIFNDFTNFNKIFKKKADYIMSSIIGLDGLEPTIKIIKFTKKIAIANKESLICGWDLINKSLIRNKTKFIPVDSEHFSLWFGLNNNYDHIEKIVLTASGGPFINLPLNKFKNINVSQALKHPNWKMGKKITIDSATMMNKVYEIIEAKNIFNLNYNQISILTHPSSYVHGIIKFKNGLIKVIAHETDMKIPIFNSIQSELNKISYESKNIDVKKLNQLNFKKVNKKKFPLTNILKILPKKNSLFETVLVSANDELVNLFLNKKIKFTSISKMLLSLVKDKNFNKYKRIKARNVNDIKQLNKYVRLKIKSKSI
tara:strand:+ start:866 stop:2029 length:1164 start_codon:yes stop_codon:yes gene_type:complete